MSSLPVAFRGLLRRKMTLGGILRPHKIPSADLKAVQSIFDRVESREERYELNLYITGSDEDNAPLVEAETAASNGAAESAPAGESAAESSPPPVDPGPAAVTAVAEQPAAEAEGGRGACRGGEPGENAEGGEDAATTEESES